MDKRYRGIVALLATSILWGSSFPVIKYVVGSVDEYTYTWMRSLLAMLGLAPYVIYAWRRGYSLGRGVSGGLIVGATYAMGLWLQGWGTVYTSASNAAFITGLSVVFVHIYVAVVEGRYDYRLALMLVSAVLGLYLLSEPGGELGFGDMLVLLGALFWAAQILLVDKYSGENPLVLAFAENMPALLFIAPSLLTGGLEWRPPGRGAVLALIYLSLICSDAAYALQFYGQRLIKPAVAGIIFLLEPVSAAILDAAMLHEYMASPQILGASLILLSLILAVTMKAGPKNIRLREIS